MIFKSIGKLLITFENLQRKQSTLLVGIDGCGGSGKSTLAEELTKLSWEITIVHMDDFYLPSDKRINGTGLEKPIGADFDWQRLKEQVLEPLTNNEMSKYQVYDWSSDKLGSWNIVSVGGIAIIEGVYSTRKELTDFYDYRIFVDCPRNARLARGIKRDGEAARDIWEKNWMTAEDKYMNEHKPYERADLIVDGFGNT